MWGRQTPSTKWVTLHIKEMSKINEMSFEEEVIMMERLKAVQVGSGQNTTNGFTFVTEARYTLIRLRW